MVKEPTEKMLTAAADWSREKYGKPIGNDAAIGCWRAMSAALPVDGCNCANEDGDEITFGHHKDCPQYGDAGWRCKARVQGSPGGNTPPDCDWPMCGCDPYANKVIAALEESDVLKSIPA